VMMSSLISLRRSSIPFFTFLWDAPLWARIQVT
jgi:hypothetical protein